MGLFRNWRSHYRTARSLRRLAAESAFYRQRFHERSLTVPDDAEIRRQIVRRFPGQIPRKGTLRILSIYHDYNWEGPAFDSTLAAFGEVCHLDWQATTNEGLMRAVSVWATERPFDVAFTYLSGGQMSQALRDAIHAPIVNLALNDKEAFVGKVRRGRASGNRDICRYFDLCWTSTRDALEKYVVEGAIPIYLPEGGNPGVHRPYDEEKRFDVSFVGQCYGDRPGVIARLREAGVQVEAFGPGWPNGPLSTEEMVRTWSRSRINLGFGGVLGHNKTFCLKGRDFEVPMSGGLYLTEQHEELAPFYEIGREIVTYTGFDELLERIRWLLSHPDEVEVIRQAGRARALREHSWEKRFEHVFRLMGVLG